MKNNKLLSVLILVVFMLGICFIMQAVRDAAAAASSPFEATREASYELQTQVAILLNQTPTQSFEAGFARIDEALKQSIIGSIAYNPPVAMKLDQTYTIELLINPSIEPLALATQINESSQVIAASIQITPQMKVVLTPQEDDAFIIRPIHDGPEQLISTTETTKWSWDITAKKGGTHRLTLVIYRLLTVDENETWRLVESYKSDIEVKVAMSQYLLLQDWKWIAGFILALIGSILGVLSWLNNRKKEKKEDKPPKSIRKAGK